MNKLVLQYVRDVSNYLGLLHDVMRCGQIDGKPENVLAYIQLPNVTQQLESVELVTMLMNEALDTNIWRVQFAPCDHGLTKSADKQGNLRSISGSGTPNT